MPADGRCTCRARFADERVSAEIIRVNFPQHRRALAISVLEFALRLVFVGLALMAWTLGAILRW